MESVSHDFDFTASSPSPEPPIGEQQSALRRALSVEFEQERTVLSSERRLSAPATIYTNDTIFLNQIRQKTHWSIAWSDLMMTMFILFLSMFSYQAAHEEFLVDKGPEVIGGDTTDALQVIDGGGINLPANPETAGRLPFITAGTLKKIEPIYNEESFKIAQPHQPHPVKSSSQQATTELKQPTGRQQAEEQVSSPKVLDKLQPAPLQTGAIAAGPGEDGMAADKVALLLVPDSTQNRQSTAEAAGQAGGHAAEADVVMQHSGNVPEQSSLSEAQAASEATNAFQEIYRLSQDALQHNNLSNFAAIDLVPDKTMRIILTSDLLFGLGESKLSKDSLKSLGQIAEVIRHTPYMINIVGHTDNVPMRSKRFESNWDLSLARASTVARFLIDEMGMNPQQFVVSGYSSYRPLKPNTNAANRAQNRRVEIIISKKLAVPEPVTDNNLQ